MNQAPSKFGTTNSKLRGCSKIGIMLIAVVTGILKLLGGSIIPGAELAFYWK
jgi:hypothetical protein